MGGIAQKGNIIFVSPEIAQLEGVDINKLVAYYATDGIKLVTQPPYFLDGEDRWVCNGCKVAWERTSETWRRSTIDKSGWQPLCRECEGTVLDQSPGAVQARLAYNKANENVIRKKPGKPASGKPSNHPGPAKPGQGKSVRGPWIVREAGL
jgi:hypothetical protein